MFLDTMIVQSTRDLFLGTLLVSVFSAVLVQSNPFASLPPLSAPRIYLSFKALMLRTLPLALPEGPRGVPRPAERHSLSSVSWVFPGASSRWGMPGTPLQGDVPEASETDARATSTASFRCGGAAALLRAPPRTPPHFCRRRMAPMRPASSSSSSPGLAPPHSSSAEEIAGHTSLPPSLRGFSAQPGGGRCSSRLRVRGRRSVLLLGGGRRLALLLDGRRRSALLLGGGCRSAPLLGCGRRLGPSGLTVMPIAPPTCLALLLAPPTHLAVFLAPVTYLALLLAPPTCLALLFAPLPCCLSVFFAPLRVSLDRRPQLALFLVSNEPLVNANICFSVFSSLTELKSTGTAHHFAFLLNSTDYRVLRMDEDHDRMYVGSKDYILSLDLNDINKEPLIVSRNMPLFYPVILFGKTYKIHWPVAPLRKNECVLSGKDINGECGNFIRLIEPWNRTHLYVCGTGAYNPICTYVDRGQKSQALLQNQNLRAGGRTSRAAEPSASPEPYAPKEYIFRLEPGKVDSGKGKCPFDPKLNSVSALINGQLYAGVYIDFMGTDSAIFRTLGKHTAMRTDQYNSRWLNDPTFVHAQLIPDSAEKNDDKLYFFFREKASEMGQTPMTQSRIGRICLNDDGGHCCLVNKWSTFLKARLICSVTGADGIETHFDELPLFPVDSFGSIDPYLITEHLRLSLCTFSGDVFIQKTQDTKNPVIYGVFSVSGSVFKGSAICVYSMADVRMVFNGPFAHKEGPNYQWIAYQGKIPYPRPGTCPGGTFTPNMKSTKDYPDEVINFMRNHPTMYNAVYPVHKRPLVVRTNVDYEFTTITVDQVTAADGSYEVLFLGTDRGTVQKVIVLPRDDLQTEELVLEEVEVFRVPTPITTMKISPKRQQLYVSSAVGVTHLALHRCDVYGEGCADCCLARDPYCAWDGKSCSRYSTNHKRRSRRQDVKYGNPIRQCRGYNSNANRNTLEAVQYGVEGSTAFLECQARSPHVSIKWHFQKENSDRRREIRSDGRVLHTDQGLLLRSLQLSDAGTYQCTATEKNFKHTLVKLQLLVLSVRTVNNIQMETGASIPAMPAVPLQTSAWTPSAEQYKDLLTILSQPEMGLIN
ncbi:hypothetical protein QTP86_019707, partial [Hemibagrus guttatus]